MLLVLASVVAQLSFVGYVTPAAAVDLPTIDLRVLVLDDDSPWVDGMADQLTAEGVPFTAVPVALPSRPEITASYLANDNHAFFQAVIAPSYSLTGLTADEMTTLRAFEAKFGVREVDMFNYPSTLVGMQTPSIAGSLSLTASVTAAGQANGFQYLNGPVPLSQGNYTYLSTPLTATSTPGIASGASFTTLVSAPISYSTKLASLIGVYSAGGVEQMIVTSAMNFNLLQFKLVAHGIISWATRGVHLGNNRNRMTFHVDDAFASLAMWDSNLNCTPSEDCPPGTVAEGATARMTPDDVTYAKQWQAANNFQLTLAFNGSYAEAGDSLTDSLVANRASFRWLNHGFEHIYQGCIQDFSVVPWKCTTDPATGETQYLSQADIYNEITANIATGNALGLPFDSAEYLSGEHSGLFHTPQQPDDNPNFASALTQAGIGTIGADASREPSARRVGSAMTVPRHPTILYYNASTVAAEVDEYNWFYTSRDNGGSGYCEDNPATATCGTPMIADDYFTKIVPADAAFNLGFILSNDPRPYYAHTSNMTNDRIMYPLLELILGTYRTAFSTDAPLLNQTQTQASLDMVRQDAWATSGMAAIPLAQASVTGNVVTVVNTGAAEVPLTVPVGTTVSGTEWLEAYGGELSGWVPATPTTVAMLPIAPAITLGGSPDFQVDIAGQLTISTPAAQPAASISVHGTLPAGLNVTVDGTGGAAISGMATVAALGDYPITISATNESGTTTVAATLRVGQLPQITGAVSTTLVAGTPFSMTITTSGSPTATLSLAGALPAGVAFTTTTTGTATLAGTPTASSVGVYPLSVTATNWAGTTTQDFVLTINSLPTIISRNEVTFVVGKMSSFTIRSKGTPTPALTVTGQLPPGVSFSAAAAGTGVLSGKPTAIGTYSVTVTATNTVGSATQDLKITVRSK
ncbi:MAG: Ig domain-containing protein [Ilumatobacteraceae bacterium]